MILAFPKYILSSCITGFAMSKGASSSMKMILSRHALLLKYWNDLFAQDFHIVFIDVTNNRIHITLLLEKTWPYNKWHYVLAPYLPFQNEAVLVQMEIDFLLPISCNFVHWQGLADRNGLFLSTKCFLAIHCPLLCEQEILEQKLVLLASQQEATLEHM